MITWASCSIHTRIGPGKNYSGYWHQNHDLFTSDGLVDDDMIISPFNRPGSPSCCFLSSLARRSLRRKKGCVKGPLLVVNVAKKKKSPTCFMRIEAPKRPLALHICHSPFSWRFGEKSLINPSFISDEALGNELHQCWRPSIQAHPFGIIMTLRGTWVQREREKAWS